MVVGVRTRENSQVPTHSNFTGHTAVASSHDVRWRAFFRSIGCATLLLLLVDTAQARTLIVDGACTTSGSGEALRSWPASARPGMTTRALLVSVAVAPFTVRHVAPAHEPAPSGELPVETA